MAALSKRIRTAVGGDMLGDNYYKFLLVHTGFMIFTGLPSVFINTFLMSQTNNMDVVLIYNALSYMGTAVGMFFSAAVVHRFHAGVSSVMGILGYDLLYFELIVFNTSASKYVFLLGITGGAAGAFYWLSYSQLFTESTNLRNRDSGLAIISIMTSTVNLVVPLSAGTVISAIGGLKGYNVIFGLAFVIGIVTAVGAIRLPKTKTETVKVHHKEAIQYVLKHKAIFWGMMSEGFKGIRDGAFAFILSILLYKMINSEVLIGFNTFLSSTASILSYLFISKRIRGGNRIKFMEIAVVSLTVFGVFTVFAVNPVVLIVYTVVNAFFAGFIVNSSFGTFLDAVQTYSDAANFRPEFFAQKELYLATGRCFGILIIMFLDRFSGGSLTWQAVSLVILTLMQVGTLAACRHAMNLVNRACNERCAK